MKKWTAEYKDRYTNGKWSIATAICETENVDDMINFWGFNEPGVQYRNIKCEDFN